jgi:hypothetical protein
VSADRPVRARDRIVAFLVAVPIFVGGGLVALAGLVFSGLTCDESCDYGAIDWRHDPDAWQWGAQAVLAGGVFVASLVLAVLLVSGEQRGRRAALAAGLGLLVAWLAFLNT